MLNVWYGLIYVKNPKQSKELLHIISEKLFVWRLILEGCCLQLWLDPVRRGIIQTYYGQTEVRELLLLKLSLIYCSICAADPLLNPTQLK